MKFRQPNFRLADMTAITLSLWIISACASFQSEEEVLSAPELLQEGIKGTKKGYMVEAASAFQQVLEDYPDSKERVKALLLLARTYYSNEEYEEAKFHFQKFIELYPAHRQTDLAYFYNVMSDYKRIDLAQRDQTYTQEALDGFERLITRFPKSQYLNDARIKKQECETILAKNIFEIGKFYFSTGSYQPAITRFKNLMGKYPNQKFQSEAVFLIAESYYHEQNFSKAANSYKQFLKKYPRSPFTLQARKRLSALRRNQLYDR